MQRSGSWYGGCTGATRWLHQCFPRVLRVYDVDVPAGISCARNARTLRAQIARALRARPQNAIAHAHFIAHCALDIKPIARCFAHFAHFCAFARANCARNIARALKNAVFCAFCALRIARWIENPLRAKCAKSAHAQYCAHMKSLI